MRKCGCSTRFCFFFSSRRRHTRWPRDWSSDVCSSDLHPIHPDHTPTGQLSFGVFFQGVNSSTIWRLPESGDQVAFESFESLARTAERGTFAAFFLGEGLRLREHRGVPFELDVAGRPDAQTLLAALAAVTERIGLVATQNTTYNDPADLARRLQTLDLISRSEERRVGKEREPPGQLQR